MKDSREGIKQSLLRGEIEEVDENLQDEQLNAEDSEDERIRAEEAEQERMQTEVRQKKEVKSMVVGSGFSFDITEFFKFEKKVAADELVRKMTSEQLFFKRISGGHLAWVILLYSVCNAAMIPPWIMSIKATKLLRISWRFLLQSFMVVPFVLYQRRTGDEKVKKMYTFSHILKLEHLKKVYLSAFATSFWFTVILTAFEWSYISHALVLGGLSNFFLSVMRMINGQKNHELEKGGQVMVMLGFLMVMQDSYLLDPASEPHSVYNMINPFYLYRQPWQRVCSDIVTVLIMQIAFFVSFVMSNFSRYNADLKEHYPPYLSMLLANIFVCFNMCLSTYFFNGATFDLDSFYGVFAIFSEKHFGGFMYMSIILGLGLFLSLVMMTKLFEDPITPAVGMLFEPIISTILLNIVGVQGLPGSLACIGYVFILPGQFLIVMGQYMLKKSNDEMQKIKEEADKSTTEIKKLKTKLQEYEMSNLKAVSQDKNVKRN